MVPRLSRFSKKYQALCHLSALTLAVLVIAQYYMNSSSQNWELISTISYVQL